MKQIIIFATQRSGSTMVCDDIAGTNKLGRPSEYFIKVINSIGIFDEENMKEKIITALKKGSTDNGISAVKIMSNQIRPIGKAMKEAGFCDTEDNEECFFKYFANSVFCRVIRKDKVAQAVSRIMARQTKVYHSVTHTTGIEGMFGQAIQKKDRDESLLEYNYEEIYKEIENIEKEENLLDKFIDRFNINHKLIVYENVINDRSYVELLAKKLGYNHISLAERHLKKVSGNISYVWINRYKIECRYK